MVCLTLQWEALTRRSMRTSQTFHPERPRKQIRNKQHRTLQGRRTRHFREQNRTSSRKNTERNNKALARTQTDDNNPDQLKISRLPRYHTQLDERSLPTIQKTERRAALHQRKI